MLEQISRGDTMKKKIMIFLSAILVLGLMGCAAPEENTEETKAPQNIDLADVNEFLNTSAGLGIGSIGNVVQVIPHAHIDGPKNETDFYAFVNFKYKARDYVKYQVTYLSCTCRSASVNYWQTAYVELSLPESKKIEDSEVRFLSFDHDPDGEYLGGFWGDSNPTPAGVTYDTFKEEYISFFKGKDAAYMNGISTMWDIDENDYTSGEGRDAYSIDTFSGSSVSTNNIIRMLDSIIDYHGQDEFFQ